jgi:hypothetical protein
VLNTIHTLHRLVDAVVIPDIANVEPELRVVHGNSHVLLLLFVPTEDAYFADIGIQKAAQHSIAERPRSARDQQDLSIKHCVDNPS